MARSVSLLFQGVLVLLALALAGLAIFAIGGPQVGYHYAVVKSGSMSPTYPVGSIVVMEKVNASDVKVGDVITWESPVKEKDEVITHRVVEVISTANGPEFKTKGDANEGPDGVHVTPPELRGRVILGIPEVGYAAPYVQQRGIFFAIVAACGAIVIAMELRNIWREVRRGKAARSEQVSS